MSRNIKEIGKELLGKSLNSYHRKTGLTQLEENNKMQDGILDGILSQVDDAYIEKTEQSNVIHLDGSGDGVVVLDSIEGNTLVNLWEFNNLTDGYFVSNNGDTFTNFFTTNVTKIKPNQKYTFITEIVENTLVGNSSINFINDDDGESCFSDWFRVGAGKIGVFKTVLTTKSDLSNAKIVCRSYIHNHEGINAKVKVRCILIEGEYLNKEMNYFKGLQSSFEENKEEDKYKIEILSDNGGNLLHGTTYTNGYFVSRDDGNLVANNEFSYSDYIEINSIHKKMYAKSCNLNICFYDNNKSFLHGSKYGVGTDGNYWVEIPKNAKYFRISVAIVAQKLANVSYQDVCNNVKPKQNKIKLLINEPLRSLPNGAKDKLCIKNNKLVVERNCKEILITGDDEYSNASTLYHETENYIGIRFGTLLNHEKHKEFDSAYNCLSDRFKGINIPYGNVMEQYGEGVNRYNNSIGTIIILSKSKASNLNDIKDWFRNNHTKLVIQLAEPTYEEVLNEYGEPILLEGYENGTIYTDSTIVPTTTVRYTPKMESFKTLNEVSDNNTMLANDINDNIIPYLMDVDLMIMGKEMALMSQYKIRRMGVKDMTSMQKRTQDMLERLIKGKTLTEQECKTRVTTYLNAGKITDAQAEELNFLIDEIYA